MANLTLSIDDELLKSARKLSIERDTSVNQMVREFLESEVRSAGKLEEAKRRLMETKYPGKSESWTRDELYDR